MEGLKEKWRRKYHLSRVVFTMTIYCATSSRYVNPRRFCNQSQFYLNSDYIYIYIYMYLFI